MINFREIFNPSYSYIGLIIIAILVILLIVLEKKKSIRIIGYSCLSSGLVLLLIYFIGNLIINNIPVNILRKSTRKLPLQQLAGDRQPKKI